MKMKFSIIYWVTWQSKLKGESIGYKDEGDLINEKTRGYGAYYYSNKDQYESNFFTNENCHVHVFHHWPNLLQRSSRKKNIFYLQMKQPFRNILREWRCMINGNGKTHGKGLAGPIKFLKVSLANLREDYKFLQSHKI